MGRDHLPQIDRLINESHHVTLKQPYYQGTVRSGAFMILSSSFSGPIPLADYPGIQFTHWHSKQHIPEDIAVNFVQYRHDYSDELKQHMLHYQFISSRK